MPDIFFDKNLKYENQNTQKSATERINEEKTDFWNNLNTQTAQKRTDYTDMLERYQVPISQEKYNVIKDYVAASEDPEGELYRWASAMQLNEQYGIPLSNAYENLEQICAAKWGEDYQFTPKTAFKAIVDSGRQGVNTLKMGMLGSQIMKAELGDRLNELYTGEEEKQPGMFAENGLNDLLEKYYALEKENEGLEDLQDRNRFIEMLKFGGQSLPFTGYVASASLLGSLLAPGVGTAAGFAASLQNASGLEYMKLRKAGSSVEAASGISLLAGGLEALVETSLGNIPAVLGKKSVAELATKGVREKITGNLFKRLAYDGSFKKLALRLTTEYLKEAPEEGLEEVIQDFIEKGADALAAELGDYEIDPMTAKTIAKDAWENFYGGAMGSLALGLVPSALKYKADIKEYFKVKKLAEAIPSQEVFNKATENSDIYRNLSDEQKKEAQKNTWEKAQARIEAAANAEARKIAEIRDVGEGEKQPVVDENGNEIETEASPVVRDETGRLFTQVKEDKDENGNITGGTFLVGDRTQSDDADNRYGYIKYSQNENGDITIDNFYMKEEREGLRQEVFEEFAREHPDVNIEWNAIDNYAKDFKNELIKNNPSGEKNGLKYFTSESLNDIQAKKDFGRAVKQFFHNDKAVKYFDENNQAKIRYEQTPLTSGQVASVIALFDTMAQRDNKSFADFLSDKFEDGVFRNVSELKDNINAYNQKNPDKQVHANNVTGAFIDKDLVRGTKAVIYAAENADYLTLMHEVAHFYQATLTGKLKKEAEAAFDVQDGNWNATSKWKGDDGKLMTKKEAFAYYFQDWLTTGRIKNETWKNVFEKFAQFLAQAYTRLKNHLTFTPEIESVFEKMLGDDKSILSKALKAAQEEEGEYRAMLKRDAEAKEAQKKAEAEKAQRQAQAEREEKNSVTDFSDKETEQSTEEIEKKLDEVTNEKTEDKTNAIDDALKDLPLTDEKKTEIADVLKDENITRVEKAEAVTEAAASVYDEEDGELPDMMFQTVAKQNIDEVINYVASGNNEKFEKELGTVTPDFEKLAEKYGEDVKGYVHSIDNYFVIHDRKRHGNQKVESENGQIAITDDDIRNIPDVLNNPDFIVFGAKNRQNNNVIVYAKNMNDGSTLYVEERRTRSKHLAANTLYKMTSASDANTLLRNPTLYAQDDRGSIKIVDVKSELVNNNISNISFQQVYHGSGADFDKFDTENFGLSGEGSMSFGYGTYVTDSEDIARDYADRQVSQKYQNVDDPYNVLKTNIIATIIHDTEIKGFEKALKERIEFLQKRIENSQGLYTEEQVENSKKVLDEIKNYTEKDLKKRRLYTVEIPDDGYLDWEKEYNAEDLAKIKEAMKTVSPDVNAQTNVNKWHFANPKKNTLNGATVYETIANYLGSPEAASKFLHSIGYAGIKYPAGTIHGNGNGAYNYVIFNDDDAQIVDKLLFQTQAELMDEARTFESWQEFMEYCEAPDTFTNVEGNPDAAWYKAFWETAKAVTKEEEKKAEVEEQKQQAEADTPEMVDRLFISYIRNNPDVVDKFVQEVADIMSIDLDSYEWANVDEEGGRERERYAVLQDYINAELSDGNWQTAIAKAMGGNEITDYIRKRLITEMTDAYKARDFRNLYSAIMKDKTYAVDALDTRAAEIERKLEKYSKRYYDIVSPTEDVTVTTPQRRKEIAQEMQNRDLAARIKSGSLKVDDEVYNYLKSVEKKEKDLKKQEELLTEKIQNLYQDIGNIGLQQLIRVHDQLMEQKTRLSNFYKSAQLRVENGLRMTDRYTRQEQEMTQTYHELERKFSDLKDSIAITEDVQEILDTQERRREIREEAKWLAKDLYLAEETKKIRINLVKSLFRKVDLAKVDFKQAQLIIAIQKLTLPNMIGGVNRWIGRKSPFLNAVLSKIVTDSKYKERIVDYLEHVEKKTDTFRDFVESIRNAKSRDDFEHWGVAEREYAIKYLPKENWVWDLKLKEKALELQESLHLDITEDEVERQVYDADGHPLVDDEGNPVTEVAYRLRVGDEALNRVLQETLGEELYNRILNSPMVEWSTQEMEELVAHVNKIRDEGIKNRATKIEARKNEAQKFIQQVADAIKDTGITINEDDTPEEIEKKLEKINEILGKNKNLKGTEASKDTGFIAKLNRIIHGYKDANVLRVCRVLDNQKEGVNTYLLYRLEDNCYNAKMRSITNRGETVYKVMAANKITEGDLAKIILIEELGTKFTVDELLFFLAADKDFKLDENGKNDNYAATSRNAVCYGNMMSDTMSQEQKKAWAELDKAMNDAIEKDLLTPEQRQLLSDKQLDTRPGTTAYIQECNRRWDIVLKAANDLLKNNPGYNALLEAIQADYADQYERMNEVSINEFNVGVNRVKCYVPLVRREQNGSTNENQVMEDLLAINGVGKGGVNKGMTQSRQTISPLHQRPVQTGLFRTWCDSVDRTEHFIAYAPYVRLLNRVYNSRDAQYLRSDIEGRYGKGMLEYIDTYIKEVANPNAINTRSAGAELLHILRGKTAPAYLGWKASGIIKQWLTSPWPYMQFVHPAEYLAAVMKFTFNPEMREAIKEKSVFMKMRRMDPLNDLIDEMADNAKSKLDRGWSNFTKLGMQGLEMIDWACVAPGWLACYEKKYNQLQKASDARYNAKMAELEERNKSGNGEYLNPTQMETIAKQELIDDIEREAVRYADDCTRQCQPSNRLTDLAPMFKDKNEFMRAFLQFQTSLNVIWQNIRYDLPYAVKQKQFWRFAGTIIGYVMAGIFMNSVMEGVAGDDDDDETQALRNLIYYSTTQFTDAIPIMGSEITNTMDQLITGKRGFAQSGTDMTPSATKLLSVLTNAKKGNWEKAARLTAEGIGLYLGAPVSGTKEIYKLLGSPLKEGDVNLARGVGDVYGLAGDIIGE